MFSFLKSKPKLADLIPFNYIDIHSHILPGIDDGSKNIESTEFLLNKMISLGFSKIITTPHTITTIWDNTNETILEAQDKVITELPSLSQQVQLRAASEYMIDEGFLKLLKNKTLLTLKDNYVLVEMSYLNPPINLYDILFELQVAGYIPVLAHPERYNFYHREFKQYEKLKKAGCLFQINLLSTTGYYGESVCVTAEKLLNLNMIDFSGSDIHHQNHIKAFQNKLQIKSITSLEKAMNGNSFFK
ncbi:MAG: tyrosine-protein phosphatase [Microbacterium sp.]|uniref:tyrosine-protein phosphatase n=1 Tax=Microbacterium sp. TaxID=51671 RepID=UPI003A85CB81